MTSIINLLMVSLIAILAFWHRDKLLYVLAGFAFILYGFNYWSTSTYLSILLVVMGLVIFLKAWLERKAKR